MRIPALVIVDCNGVLVDCELISNRVFSTIISELGAPIMIEDMFERFVAHSMPHCCALFADMIEKSIPGNFIKQYHDRIAVALRSELNSAEGIGTALDVVAARDVPV